jgi:hypothetical protein
MQVQVVDRLTALGAIVDNNAETGLQFLCESGESHRTTPVGR